MYRRECHEKYGYWNPDLPQVADWDLWIRSEADPALPPALKVDIPAGLLEQEAFWAVMSPDPASCVAHLRAAVGQALDRAARTYLPGTTELQSLRDENARLNTVVEELARKANLAGRLRCLIFPPQTWRERLWLRLRPYVRRCVTGQVAPR